MGREKITVSELVHLSLPLSAVEFHYEQESAKTLPWTYEDFLIKPYIFYKKERDQTYLYYDKKGMEWQIEQAGKYKDVSGAIEKVCGVIFILLLPHPLRLPLHLLSL